MWQSLNFSPWTHTAPAPTSWANALLDVSLCRAQMLFPLCKYQEVGKDLATLIHLLCLVSAPALPMSAESKQVEKQLEKIDMTEYCTLTVGFGENLSWDWKEHELFSKNFYRMLAKLPEC